MRWSTFERSRNLPGRVRARLAALSRDQRGVSAVEFALIGPVLFLGLVSTVDIGLAVTERMNLDHVLRAAAQSAMSDQGQDSVRKALEGIASRNFTVASPTTGSVAGNVVTLSVERFCACADNLSARVTCSATCAESAPTLAYYRMTARKAYDGMILPRMNLEVALQVQVR
jgi:pilus assembly protein CpaE